MMDAVRFDLKTKGDSGSFEGVMSAPVLDRDDEIVDFRAFEPLPDHITIDIDHGLTVEKTVGSGQPYYDSDGLLKVKGNFASTPLGQTVRTLVKEGHIRHMSVSFVKPVREVDDADGKTHVRKGELINCTITGIPANTATAIAAKVGARNSAKDLERIQGTHDHMVELGATCGEKHVHGATAMKLMPGTWILTEPICVAPGTGIVGATYKNADTEAPAETTAAEAAVVAGADVEVARARAVLEMALAELALE